MTFKEITKQESGVFVEGHVATVGNFEIFGAENIPVETITEELVDNIAYEVGMVDDATIIENENDDDLNNLSGTKYIINGGDIILYAPEGWN